jgi:DNA primase
MSAIDYQTVRSQIPMADVLKWIGFQPTSRRGPQQRGPCPLPHCPSRSNRVFSVHLQKQIYHCFGCQSQGNQLDLWAAFHQRPLYEAAITLCHRAHITVPRHNTTPPTVPPFNTPNTSPRNHHLGTR